MTKKKYLFLIFTAFCAFIPINSQTLKLWYKAPAGSFIQALPVGNGRLAAMVYGGTAEEIINLNEESFWTGGPVNNNPNPEAPSFLPKIRKALDNNDYALADELSKKMQGNYSSAYSPIGDLILKQKYEGEVSNYYRELDIAKAIATTRFNVGKNKFIREVFISAPDQLMVIHLTSSTPKTLNFQVSTKSLQKAISKADGKELIMSGNAPIAIDTIRWGDECKGMRFQVRIKSIENDGKETVNENGIRISEATTVTLVLSIATSFNGFERCPVSEGKDEVAVAKSYFSKLGNKSFANLKKAHIADYSSYFNRLRFELPKNQQAEILPTDERLQRYQTDKTDHGLEVLLYQYGRYLLISSSRPGGIPANLQGKWCSDINPPWKSNYTVNINTEMNYWAAQKTGLSDMTEPLIQQIMNMSKTGAETAKNEFAMQGWAAGHNSDVWALTNMVGSKKHSPRSANFILAGPWLCQSVWEKYAYDGDKNYLRTIAYPLMKGAAEFCLDWLVDDGKGHLTTSPSTSPENLFKLPDEKSWSVAKGSTIDIALIRNLFSNLIEATEILNIDAEFRAKLQQTKSKLLPYRVGKNGNLQEWGEDFDDNDLHHRHVSHLVGLHPGNDISPISTPELANACKKTLETRGDGGTGWSLAWKISFWARLLDGNHAFKLLQTALNYTTEKKVVMSKGGTYPNLFCAHPPFQIDGNFGAVEGISEMLMQSHLKEIYLLPALPDAWSDGSIHGLRARGCYEISMIWEKYKLKSAVIYAKKSGTCIVRTNTPITIKGLKVNAVEQNTSIGKTYLNTFETKAGTSYQIIQRN